LEALGFAGALALVALGFFSALGLADDLAFVDLALADPLLDEDFLEEATEEADEDFLGL
jgi:hypothetical protein